MVLAAFAGAVLGVVHHLDAPWIKRRVVALVQGVAGLDVDYAAVRVRELSGVTIDGLTVRAPAELRGAAPDVARVDRLAIRWTPASLIGRGPRIEAVEVHGLSVTVVIDEHGRTTFDVLFPPHAPAAPPTPLSRLPASILGARLPIGRVELDGVALALLRTEAGRVVERDTVTGLVLVVAARPDGAGTRIAASIGSSAAPVEIALSRTAAGATSSARVRARVALGASATDASADIDVAIVEQDIVAGASVAQLADVHAAARFDPRAGRTSLELARGLLADGAVALAGALDVPDAARPVVRRLDADVDAVRLAAALPRGLVPWSARRAVVHAALRDLDLGRPKASGRADVEAELEGVELRRG
ncbi:MAG TPA: hypothetical protein VHB21_19930, partial [Minicystis sp.]|nr:hypothetical protein [Minicystis sp.]